LTRAEIASSETELNSIPLRGVPTNLVTTSIAFFYFAPQGKVLVF
jgi:hypothetical protein